MMVLGVNSKRQRRPNVRLGEIGDVSAAVSRGSSWKFKGNWVVKKLKQELRNSKETDFHVDCGFPSRKSDFIDSDPGVSPRLDTHNRENRNPNSVKTFWEFTGLQTDVSKPKLNFGKVTRRSRLTKRRGHSVREHSVTGSAWNSRAGPEICNEKGKGYGGDAFGEPAYNGSCDVYTLEEFKDPLDHETSDVSKHTYENESVEPISDMQAQDDSDEFWTGNVCKEKNGFSSDDGQCFNHKIGEVDGTMNGVMIVHNVGGWLEELGFGKYARIFEMHEVDEEVLPLLTFDDLKEMGINAVGPRRKLFTAIQLLKEKLSAQ